MTISIALKVGDGIVFGADSASTLMGTNGVAKVFFNAEKITNLVKGLPLGMVIFGLGGMDGRSMTSIMKDLRERLTEGDAHWRVKGTPYTIQRVADLVREFIYEELYLPRMQAAGAPLGVMGLLVGGFATGADHPEVWGIQIDERGGCAPAACVIQPGEFDTVWGGAPEALQRLMRGWSSQVQRGMIQSGLPPHEVSQFLESLQVEPLVHATMPLQDAIDLVKYMAEVTIGFVRFAPGAPTVAEPIDIATITKHEGFRWVRRKHYYSSELNPRYRTSDALLGMTPESNTAIS